jgi:hypothetical protein
LFRDQKEISGGAAAAAAVVDFFFCVQLHCLSKYFAKNITKTLTLLRVDLF